jgi:menaquinone-dependent protoporphyrinogen oxidase
VKVVVAYASKYGFTKGIAERIADKMRSIGVGAEAKEVDQVDGVAAYDAFVIGSAVFFGKWMKEAHEFVTRNQALLATRPVWLFSSGPVGTETKTKKGESMIEASIPKDIEEFKGVISPRDHHVFYGGFNSSGHGVGGWFVRRIPAASKALIEGDFRNWTEIETWAAGIAKELEAPKTE